MSSFVSPKELINLNSSSTQEKQRLACMSLLEALRSRNLPDEWFIHGMKITLSNFTAIHAIVFLTGMKETHIESLFSTDDAQDVFVRHALKQKCLVGVGTPTPEQQTKLHQSLIVASIILGQPSFQSALLDGQQDAKLSATSVAGADGSGKFIY